MARITKNARERLIKFVYQFHMTAGEFVGITFIWVGSLEIVGANKFSEFIQQNKEEAWRCLTLSSNTDKSMKTLLDIEMFNLLTKSLTSVHRKG